MIGDERILIVRLGALGDIVHALPLARALRANRPGAFIGWAVEERYRELVEADPDVDLVIPVRRRGGGPGGFAWVARLREARFDVALDAQGLVKSALVAFVSGAPRRIGFHPGDRRERLGALLTNERLPPVERNGRTGQPHVAEKNLALLGGLGVETRSVAFPALLPETASRRRIALHPGAGWDSKRWPIEAFAELGDRLASELGFEVLVTWGPGEDEQARAVAVRMRSSSVLLARCGPMGLAREIAHCRLAIGADTGPIHLAAALGIPSVSLFGPTDPRRNGPIGASGSALWVERPCRGCWKRRCPRGEACLAAIPVEQVFSAALALLG